MPRPVPPLTAAELAIMKALWQVRRGNVAQVRAALAGRGVRQAYTTVMTLLGRMVAKDAVRVERTRQPFVYRPAASLVAVQRARLGQLVREVFDDDAEAVVGALVEAGHLRPAALRRLARAPRRR